MTPLTRILWMLLVFIMAAGAQTYFVWYGQRHSLDSLALFGLILAAALFFALIFIYRRLGRPVRATLSQPVAQALQGLSCGLIAVFFALVAYKISHASSVDAFVSSLSFPAKYDVFRQLKSSLGLPVLQEIGFRFGFALLAATFYGRWAGLAAGTCAFLLLSLAQGHVGVSSLIVLAAFGLFFSVIFFRFGLWAAIAAHFFWDFLAGVLVRPLSFSRPMFLGSRENMIVLIVLSGLLLVQASGRMRTARAR